ncbi:MAG: hypothetical protein MUP69_07630 [Candidatus Atribacteria bacterium]|nr:hypothetical protein [Candidatus Atribacteria bacterium]
MKKLIYLIVLVLILGLVLSGCLLSNVGQVPATEQSDITYLTKTSTFTVGNDAIVRPNTDTYTDFTIIDTNNPSSYFGLLTTYSYYAANTNPFRFVLVDELDVVQWVSEQITPPGTGVQSWNPSTPGYVEPNWNLGLYFASTGTVPFSYTGDPAWYKPNNSGLPVVGETLSYEGSSNRIYSFVATGDVVPSVPTIIWPANGACSTTAALIHIDWTDSIGTFTPLVYKYEAYGDADYTANIYSSGWLSDSEIPSPGTPEDVYYVRVMAQDSMGNFSDWSNDATDPYKITVDNTPPEVTIHAPVDGGFYPVGAVPALDYTVTDNLDPAPDVDVLGYDIVPGEHTVTVTATDCAGNVGSTSVTYYVLENFVTGGGKINTPDGKKAAWTFAGTVGNLEDGSVGQFQIVDHTNKIAYHCNNDFSYLVFDGGDTATFTGTFTNNKSADTVELTIIIEDLGEPGAGTDTISVTGFVNIIGPTTINGGNFQVHDLEG